MNHLGLYLTATAALLLAPFATLYYFVRAIRRADEDDPRTADAA